jgi:hypothetical protein
MKSAVKSDESDVRPSAFASRRKKLIKVIQIQTATNFELELGFSPSIPPVTFITGPDRAIIG